MLTGYFVHTSQPKIVSSGGLDILYAHAIYDLAGQLHLKVTINSPNNYTDAEAKVVLYNNNHKVVDVEDGF
jgi:hypothetical protein